MFCVSLYCIYCINGNTGCFIEISERFVEECKEYFVGLGYWVIGWLIEFVLLVFLFC